MFGKKGSKILKQPPVRNCFTLAMANKLVVIINSLKVPKTEKILLYERKFLLPNSYVYLLYCVCIAVFTLDAGLLTISQYSEGPATDHLHTGFSWFPCVYKQVLRWFPRFQVATTCFSCSPFDLNLVVTVFTHVK